LSIVIASLEVLEWQPPPLERPACIALCHVGGFTSVANERLDLSVDTLLIEQVMELSSLHIHKL
jgi:hypothetical protein